jgi:hypothetical protein
VLDSAVPPELKVGEVGVEVDRGLKVEVELDVKSE